MTMVGADTTQLRDLATFFDSAAANLDSSKATLSARLQCTSWTGSDYEYFINLWSSRLVPSLGSSVTLLRNASTSLLRQAVEQDTASQGQGGGIGAAVGAAVGAVAGGTAIGGVVGAAVGGVAVGASASGRTATVAGPGDLGAGPPEFRGQWNASDGTPEEVGRDVIMRALHDTDDPTKIAPDEFEIIELENGKYIVVLPGVTDLSAWGPWALDRAAGFYRDSPLGLDPTHRSVRDLDYGAISSAGGTSTADNPYAQYVMAAMKDRNIPPGSDITIVGHSYGADTAVDLAANPNFNGGPDGYNVTHVLAAGYSSKPGIADVPGGTEVLAIQNFRDAAVIAERYGEPRRQVAEGVADVVIGTVFSDPRRVFEGTTKQLEGTVNEIRDVGGTLIDGIGSVADGLRRGDLHGGIGEAVADAVTLEPGTSTINGHTNIVFRGGGEGVGHDPQNYVDFVGGSASPDVDAFARSLAKSGYGGTGDAIAFDVSVPG